MSSRRQVSRLISLLTLSAQLLGLVHLAAEEHTLSSGRVVEPVLLEGEAHEHAGAHLCETAALAAPEPDQGCAVAASWTTSGVLGAPRPGGNVPAGGSAGVAGGSTRCLDDDVLARAPKGSPPAA